MGPAEPEEGSAVTEDSSAELLALCIDLDFELGVVGRHEGIDRENQLGIPGRGARQFEHEGRVLAVRPDAGRLQHRPPLAQQALGPRALAEDDLLSRLHGAVELLERHRAQEDAKPAVVV